jgi:SAM-dependent methyltransferase
MLAMQPAILGTAFVALLFFAYSHLVGAIWVPAPTGDVRAVLDRLQLGRSATFLELGAGSGNIAVLATEYFDTVQAVEVNPLMFAVARLRTRGRVSLRRSNLWSTDLSGADVVYFFLMDRFMDRLGAKLRQELKPGAFVISYTFPLPGRQPVFAGHNCFVYEFQ